MKRKIYFFISLFLSCGAMAETRSQRTDLESVPQGTSIFISCPKSKEFLAGQDIEVTVQRIGLDAGFHTNDDLVVFPSFHEGTQPFKFYTAPSSNPGIEQIIAYVENSSGSCTYVKASSNGGVLGIPLTPSCVAVNTATKIGFSCPARK